MNAHSAATNALDPARLQAVFERECQHYIVANPHSQALALRAKDNLMFGVPMHWMRDWSMPFALHAKAAQGAELTDVDGHRYTDFCLGDTGAMFGHSPPAVARAVAAQAAQGLTTMLPSEDGVWVAEELARRFGLPVWQFALSASDANRFALRWARAMTGRTQLLVFNGCYHGTVDDVFVDLEDGQPRSRDSLLGQVVDITLTTRCVEFNDLAALEAALADRQVACLMAEPVMTNIGMVMPEPGFWQAAQALCRKYGTLLLLDETHTISSGPGGYTRAHGLSPDLLVLGKPVAGGIAGAVYGFSAEAAQRAELAKSQAAPGHSGIGTTLTANWLTLAAMRAQLSAVMTDAAYATMFALAENLATRLRAVIARHNVRWCVTQVGARTEFQFTPATPRNGTEAGAILAPELERIIHLYLLNRGLIITPFHNMMLVCPDTPATEVARLAETFDAFLSETIQA